MAALDKSKVQLIVALVLVGLWTLSVLVAIFDGLVMVKVMTPLMTMMVGWLFTDKAVSS